MDGRCLLNPESGGVFAYASNVLRALRRRNDLDLRVWANAAAGAKPEVVDRLTRWPNKLLHASILLTGRPRLDRMSGGSDVFWMPNLHVAAVSPSVRLALTVHDLSFERYPEFFSLKQRLWHAAVRPRELCRRADALIAVSASTKRDLVELYGIAPEKITVTHHGVSAAYRAATQSSDSKMTHMGQNGTRLPERFILHVGALEPRKNHLALLDAFALLKTRPTHGDLNLVLAGPRGWRNGEILRAIATHPNRADIRLLGFVPEAEKPSLYRLASVFAFPSFYEGFGLPPLEAMASGTPVVAGFASSLGEVVGDAGILIDPYRPAELADALDGVLSSSTLAAELSRRGKNKAQAFTWEACAERTSNALAARVGQ